LIINDGGNMTENVFPKILLIDDEQNNLQLLREYLESENYELFFALNGEAGIEAAIESAPDLILLDVNMPGMDGFSVCRKLKTIDSTSSTPVLFMTAYSSREDRIKGFSHGAIDYITKPFDPEEILVRVNNHIRMGMAQKELTQTKKELEEHLNRRTEELAETRSQLRSELELRRIHEVERLRADKLRSLGELVTGVAHEVNNPNSYIMLNHPIISQAWKDLLVAVEKSDDIDRDSLLLSGMSYDVAVRSVNLLLDGTLDGSNRIKKIVGGLKDYVNAAHVEHSELINVNKSVAEAVRLQYDMLSRSTDNLIQEIAEEELFIYGDKIKFEQVLVNLIQNACEALQSASQSVKVTVRESDSVVEVIICDEGMGISEENMRFVEDPFFTTKRSCGGTGLGLALTRNILTDMQGDMVISSELGRGTVVTILLKKCEEE